MSSTLREQGIDAVHDQVVSLIAQRWAKAFVCKVTIRTGTEHNPWAEPNQLCYIVGWYVSSGVNSMEWMAEVDTEETGNDPGRALLPARAPGHERACIEALSGSVADDQLHL